MTYIENNKWWSKEELDWAWEFYDVKDIYAKVGRNLPNYQ